MSLFALPVTPPARRIRKSYLDAQRESRGSGPSAVGMETISYPHIPPQVLFPPARDESGEGDVRLLAKSIGYVMGAGDEVPDALRQLGAEVTMLSPEDLRAVIWRGLTRSSPACVPTTRARIFAPTRSGCWSMLRTGDVSGSVQHAGWPNSSANSGAGSRERKRRAREPPPANAAAKESPTLSTTSARIHRPPAAIA